MSDIKFYCSSCGKKLGIDARAIGLMVPCPQCGKQLRVPDKSEESPVPPVSAPLLARPALTRVPPVPVPPSTPKPPPVSAPPPDTAVINDLKNQIQKLKQQNSLLLTDLEKGRKELASVNAELEKQQASLKEKEAQVETVTLASNRTLAELAEAKKTGEEEALKVQGLQGQVEKLTGSLARQEQKVAELESVLQVKTAALEKALTSSAHTADSVKQLEERNAAITADLALRMNEIEALKKERADLLVHKQDAAALSNSMAELQKELKELRNQESQLKQAVEQVESNISKKSESLQPVAAAKSDLWEFSDPFQKARKWAVIFAGIAIGAVLCSVVFVLLWKTIQNKRNEVPPLVAPVDSGNTVLKDTHQEVELGVPFVIDDVEVLVSRARIAPVEIISLLGNKELTSEKYFILDVRLSNRSPDRELILRKPWQDVRLLDDQSRLLRPAFTEPMALQEVRGLTLDEAVAPGNETASMIIFEWPNINSVSFTLKADPGFKKLVADDKIAQISYDTFEMTIPRVRVQE